MSSVNELALKAKSGCQDSQTDLFKLITHKIRLNARRLSPKNLSDAEEISADGISSLMRSLATWNPEKPASFLTWAMHCAENAMLNRLRSVNRTYREVQLERIHEHALVEDEGDAPLDTFDEFEGISKHGDAALHAIRQMSDAQQSLLLMVLDNQPLASISKSLGITVEESRSRLRMALNFINFEINANPSDPPTS